MAQNNYTNTILNVYIAYDLDIWRKIPFRNSTLQNYWFRLTNIVKDNDKEEYVYSGYGIAFDGKGKWCFDHD